MQKTIHFHDIIFIVFLVIYSLSASVWQLPFSSILRWIAIVGLCVCGIQFDNKMRIVLFAKEYYWILATFVLGLFVSIGQENFLVGLERTISFFMLTTGIYTFFNREKNGFHDVERSILLFSYTLEFLTIALAAYYICCGQTFGEFRGIYANRNYTVPILCTAVGTSSILFINEKKKIIKLFHLFSIIVAFFLIIATGSRAGLFSIVVYIFSFTNIVKFKKSDAIWIKRLALFCFIISILILIINNLEIPALERILGDNNDAYSNGITRGDVWGNGISFFLQRPLFGWGSSAAYYHVYILGDEIWGVHSSYILILVDHGIIGAMMIVLFFVFIIKRYILSYQYISNRCDDNNKQTIMLLVSVCISLLVDALAESFLFGVGNFASICFWLTFIFIDLYLQSYRTLIEHESS